MLTRFVVTQHALGLQGGGVHNCLVEFLQSCDGLVVPKVYRENKCDSLIRLSTNLHGGEGGWGLWLILPRPICGGASLGCASALPARLQSRQESWHTGCDSNN